jgi:hypothetical protein
MTTMTMMPPSLRQEEDEEEVVEEGEDEVVEEGEDKVVEEADERDQGPGLSNMATNAEG